MSIHTVYKFRHYNGDGKMLWASGLTGLGYDQHGDNIAHEGLTHANDFEVIRNQNMTYNTLVDEGELDMLDVYFDAQAVRTTLYFRLYDIASPLDTDDLTDISAEEVTGTGYDGITVTRGTDWGAPALDGGDGMTTSTTKQFTGGAGGWTGADQLVLSDAQNGTSGIFIAYADLSATRTLAENDTLDVSMAVKLA